MAIIVGEIREKRMAVTGGIGSGFWIMLSKKEKWRVVRRR